MKTLILSKDELTDRNLQKAAKLILESKIVAFPTETVYGLGAHVFDEGAIEEIFTLKQRPKNKSLIVHLGKIEDVDKVAVDVPDEFYLLAENFFPGPLTIILKKNSRVPSNVSSDSTIAVRMPDNIYTLKLINFVKDPIVGSSANISSEKNPVCADDVIKTFNNKIDVIIDGGECPLKVPSTIIDLVQKPFKILRQGSITQDQIDQVIKT
ncbi:MAG: L-threonylcarbamoyladenylate synthase [Parachlamydiales bacterium]|jgi:L-threonylcarbamoyladenylate synthase